MIGWEKGDIKPYYAIPCAVVVHVIVLIFTGFCMAHRLLLIVMVSCMKATLHCTFVFSLWTHLVLSDCAAVKWLSGMHLTF